MDEQLAYFGFSHCLGLGPVAFDALIKRFGTAGRAYDAKSDELKSVLGFKKQVLFSEFRNRFNAEKKLKEINGKGIVVLSRQDKKYPHLLKEISDAPICLYVKGDLDSVDLNKLHFAVVGTRMATSYGVQIARLLARELAESGVSIVSGMALGIDSQAHYGCLEAKGTTIAILGGGVDIVYPPQNKQLYDQILNNKGLIMSEFPPGMTALKGLFIARNRIVSGMSKGVLVVEGAQNSGAMVTARIAAEQGRDVFAVPQSITSPVSKGPNLLIREGATLVTSVDDILEELNLQRLAINTAAPKIQIILSEEEEAIVTLLSKEPKQTDEIVRETEIAPRVVLQTLSTLEIKSVLEKNLEGKYQVRLS